MPRIGLYIVLLTTVQAATCTRVSGETCPLQSALRETQKHTISKNELTTPRKALQAIERARKHFAKGDLRSVTGDITLALKIAPRYGVAESLRAGMYLEAEDYAAASSYFRRAIEDGPSISGAYVGLALTSIHYGQSDAAIPLLEKAESLQFPGKWFLHYTRAWAYMELGKVDHAFEDAGLAQEEAGKNTEKLSGMSFLRANVYMKLDEECNAERYLTEAIALNPGGVYALRAKSQLDRLVTASE